MVQNGAVSCRSFRTSLRMVGKMSYVATGSDSIRGAIVPGQYTRPAMNRMNREGGEGHGRGGRQIGKGEGGEGEGTPNHGSGHELTELGAGENAPGSRTPPSHTEPLPSRNGPALPPLSAWLVQGPLSLVKKTMVLSATPADSTAPSTSPTSQSSSATMSPNSPRLLTPQNLGDAKFGVWTCYHGNVMGWGWGRGVASERAGASK